MSYFIISNNNKILNKKNENKKNKINFIDLKNYMEFLNKNYIIENNNNDINELIEIFSQLHINKNNVFFDLEINTNINNYLKEDSSNFHTVISNKLNYNIDTTRNLIFRVDYLLNNTTLEYIYNLLLLYEEIIIYNCFVTNLNSYRIFIICSKSKEKNNYFNINKIPYLFITSIKNIYYQIIQNRFNNIKKEINQEERVNLWKKMYLN